MKSFDKKRLHEWWAEVKDNLHPDEIIRQISDNKKRMRRYISSKGGGGILYRLLHHLLSLFSTTARFADYISETVQGVLARFPLAGRLIRGLRGWKNHLNFRELVEFMRAKVYSLTHPPHNEKNLNVMEEIIEFAHRHGLDLNRQMPAIRRRLDEKRDQMLQHKFFQEFSKSNLERLLAVQFRFDRNIFPVLPDSAFWHKLFEFLEKRKVKDIILSGADGERVSLKKDSAKEVASSGVVRMLNLISEIKSGGRRIFFTGHHEGYLGPYFVRSVIRKLGFENLTGNCNAIAGPRMFSNVVLRNGAANVGNLFMTVPSQKTTGIKTRGLASELKKTARRTLALIKMPDSGLSLVEQNPFGGFIKIISDFMSGAGALDGYLPGPGQVREMADYLAAEDYFEAVSGLAEDDFNIFKHIMREPFLIFPEGSRSYTDDDGSVVMKYVNPRYFQAYMRPGDYIAPINLVGGSDITRGWRLTAATLGISMGEPFEVTEKMIENYEEEGINVMRKIAALPNIKKVFFRDEIQYGGKNRG